MSSKLIPKKQTAWGKLEYNPIKQDNTRIITSNFIYQKEQQKKDDRPIQWNAEE